MGLVDRRVAASWWLSGAIWSLLISLTLQEETFFKTELRPYYYSYPNHIALIQCEAVRVDDDGNETPISATLYRNSERLDQYSLPARHHAYAPEPGIVAGIIVNPTQYDDVGTRYQCGVEGGSGEVRSRETKLLVGDGRPFPATDVAQLDQRLYSVVLSWGQAPSPADSPVLGYQLSVRETEGSAEFTVDVERNVTGTELTNLKPATTYNVTVYGVNAHGQGMASEPETVMTLVPEVPNPPTNVMVTVDIGTTSSTISVTWTTTPIDPEVMTPLLHYVLFYGIPGSSEGLSSVTTPDGMVSGHDITGITQGGNMTVGVAAENSAGHSNVVYYHVVVGCGVLPDPANGEASQTGLTEGSVAWYTCHSGYALSSNLSRVCLEEGVWSNSEPTCDVVGCGVLPAPANGEASQTGLTEDSVAWYTCHSGYALSSNLSRVCLEEGVWSNSEPTCDELPRVPSTAETDSLTMPVMIGIITAVVVVALLVPILLVVVSIIIVFKRRQKMEHMVSAFENASPPLTKRKGKPLGVENDSFEASTNHHIPLAIYQEEPRALGTPPPPEMVTFGVPPSPPTQPPAYSDLEHDNRHHHGRGTGTGTETETAAEHSLEASLESSRAPLSVQYSEEPRAAGPSPALPQRGRRKDTETDSLRTELESDVNSTTIFGTKTT